MSESSNSQVTVLMPVYNAAPYLKEAIESILNQTYQDFEFIIINDGSTDDSLKVIQAFSDPRIKLITNESNLGIIATRNKGLKVANGKYIANMDADDIACSTRLEKQVRYLEQHSHVAILASKLVLIDPQGNEIGMWPEDNACVTEEEIGQTLPVINCIGQPTILMRSEVVKKIAYNKKFIHNEDWGLWLHVLSQGKKIHKLPEILLKYRVHPRSTTVSTNKLGVEKKILAFKCRYLVYKIFSDTFLYTDKQVAKSFFKEIIRFTFKRLFPRVYSFLARLQKVDKPLYFKQYFKVRKQLKQVKGKTNHLYFFPFYHTGGAERVHASILEAAQQKDAAVFITRRSSNKVFYDTFGRHATVIEIDELLKLGFSERWLLKSISTLVPGSDRSSAMGCNSLFFYQLIPYFSEKIKLIDLVHAFVHAHEEGPEKWSLPYISRLNARVVINERTKKDFLELYKKYKQEQYASRIEVISNYAESQRELPVKDKTLLNIAYIGRDGEEKRVPLIAKLAKEVRAKHTNIRFHFVGDVKHAIPAEFQVDCIFHGEISDEKKMQELYNAFHAVIIASTREGFPMVIMEGMMHGAIALSTDVGGISEHVKNNDTGFLILATEEKQLIEEFTDKILYLDQNRPELERISGKAFDYALKNFSKENFFKAWHRLLNTK